MDRVVRDPSKLKKIIIVINFLERILALLVALTFGAVLIVILARQHEGQQTLDKGNRTLQILTDCTTPGHKCYEQGVHRTARVIRQLEEIVILANLCTADGKLTTEPEIQRCVNRALHGGTVPGGRLPSPVPSKTATHP